MRFYSLKARLRLALIALAIVPLLSIGLTLAIRTYNTQLNQVIYLQEEITERVSTEVNNFTRQLTSVLTLSAQISNMQNVDAVTQRDLLFELLSSEPAFDNLSLIDRNGEEVARVSRLTVITGEDLGNYADDESFVVPFSTGEVYRGSARVDASTGQLLSTISIPLIEPRTGETTYVLAADIRLIIAGQLLSDLRDISNAYLLDSEGRVIAHPNSSIVLRETYFDLPEEAGVYPGLSGEQSVIASQPILLTDDVIYVVAEQPVSIALDIVTTTAYLLAIALVVTFILALLLATLGTRFIIQPVQELAEVARKVQTGDLSQRAVVRGQDEISVLAMTFNDMTQQLQQLINNLEQRVEERTHDLNIAAEVSRQVTRVLNMDELLPYLTNLTREGFNLSHVSVFVYDNETQTIRLQAASGDVGKLMLEQGKQFQLDDKGIVPLAARTNEAQIINDVINSKDHFVNPLLSETNSEMAVPMRVGKDLIGVLDLQSNDTNYFGDEQISVMTALADQIAVAVRNAELFRVAESARAEAEQANRVKSMFLASMSHELRTPLNSIINFTKFIVRGVMGPVNERQVETLQNVVASGEHLLVLINDVLDISKIESGSLTLFFESEVDLHEIVDSVLITAKSLIEEKPIELIVNLEPDLPKPVCDRQRVLQVMLNVMSNACKFTRSGTVELSAKRQEDHILFAVKDSGPGIPEEDFDAVFEKFKQTKTGLRQGSGTGLGMPISKSLVEAHGGRMWIESTINEGSTFYFTLPLEPVASAVMIDK